MKSAAEVQGACLLLCLPGCAMACHIMTCLPSHPIHLLQNHCLMAPFANGKRVLGALFGLDMIVVRRGVKLCWACCGRRHAERAVWSPELH